MEKQAQNITPRICPRGASYYMWRSGDTLAAVARSNGTTVQAIRLINTDVDFQTISAGTEICLPSRSLTCQSGQPYTIRSGDTLSGIAQRLGVTELVLRERNPDINPNDLVAGDVICIPADALSNESDPVLDGTAQDDNTVTPQTPLQPIVPSRPAQVCPIGYSAQRVQAGQTYADLLIDLNVSYKAMRAANPSLRPGAMIAGTPYCAPPAGTRETCAARRSYAVQDGDSLGVIAQRLNTTTGRLLMLNPTLLPTDFSNPGVVICIP